MAYLKTLHPYLCSYFNMAQIHYASRARRRKHHKKAEAIRRKLYGPRSKEYYLRQLNNRVGGYIGRELKFNGHERSVTVPSTFTNAVLDPTAQEHLCGISQGTTERSRIGRVCVIKSVHIKGHVTWPSSSTVQAQQAYCRFWLVQDTQTNGAQLSADQVLQATGLANLNVDAFQNLQYSDRFKVVKQIVVQRPTAANTSWDGSAHVSAQAIAPIVIYHKCNVKVEFSNITDGVSDITNNSFHLIGISNNMSPLPTITYRCRVRFIG